MYNIGSAGELCMTAPSRSLKELFLAALEVAPEDRAAWLERECASDAGLREHLRLMLAAHDAPQSLLDRPAESPAVPLSHEGVALTVDQAAAEGPDTVIGPYKLVEEIGEGGMGTVWMAQQTEPVKRLVAVKLIKAGMDSKLVIARFEAERQALALMDHPNIARVLDGGTTSAGRPYFVMDLVKGVPITRYCDEHHLTPRQRLELFIPVCQAVQHAHQKGIIHRDLKPSNVLVAPYDGKAVVKVIDFGVAKAAGQQLTDRTLITGFGAVVGTLEYMSPEQAELNNQDIDTRSDIYALGVLLYELLAGSPPISRMELEKAGMVEMLRAIREHEPSKPSTKLSTAEGLPTLAANRGTEPAKLTRLLRGELDWIVMKALEKDRNRRYETANGFALDVQRYLTDEPVVACPPSAGYRLRKLVRRHRGPALAAALVLLALLAGVVGTTWGLIRAEQARQAAASARTLAEDNEQKALKEKRIAEAVRAFLQRDLLGQANPAAQADTVRQLGGGFETTANPSVKLLLDRAAAELTPGKIEAKFSQQPEVQASILQTVGVTYWSIGESVKAVEFLTRSSDAYRHALGAEHPDSLANLDYLARAYLLAGKTSQAVALFEQVRDARVRKLGAGHPDTLTILDNLAWAYLVAGRTAEAVALFEQVREARVKQLGADHPDTLTTLDNLARAYLSAGKTAEAAALFEQACQARVKELGPDHPLTLMTRMGVAGVHLSAGKTAEATALFEQQSDVCRKKLGTDHPITLATQLGLAQAYRAAGKTAEAIALYQQVHDACSKKLGVDHPLTLTTLDNLAGAYLLTGKTAEAIALYEKVRDARVKKHGSDHPLTLITMDNLAGAYRDAGRTAEAIALFEQVRDLRVMKLAADHPQTLATLAGLAMAYEAAGNPKQTLLLLQQATVGIEKRQFIDPYAGSIVGALIDYFERQKKYDQAEAWRRKWMAVVKERSGAESLPFAMEMALLGRNLLKQTKWTDAEATLRECLAIREKKQPDDWTTFNAQSMLGEVLNGQKKRVEAEPLLVKGYEGMKLREANIPVPGKAQLIEAVERLVVFYEETSNRDEALKWRKELEMRKR
jgi:serine/threonine protein kinase/tetratricopeptide (TPR) repeat protein